MKEYLENLAQRQKEFVENHKITNENFTTKILCPEEEIENEDLFSVSFTHPHAEYNIKRMQFYYPSLKIDYILQNTKFLWFKNQYADLWVSGNKTEVNNLRNDLEKWFNKLKEEQNEKR